MSRYVNVDTGEISLAGTVVYAHTWAPIIEDAPREPGSLWVYTRSYTTQALRLRISDGPDHCYRPGNDRPWSWGYRDDYVCIAIRADSDRVLAQTRGEAPGGPRACVECGLAATATFRGHPVCGWWRCKLIRGGVEERPGKQLEAPTHYDDPYLKWRYRRGVEHNTQYVERADGKHCGGTGCYLAGTRRRHESAKQIGA